MPSLPSLPDIPITIAQALQQAQQDGLPRLEAQLLLLHALERQPVDRAWLLAHDEQPLQDCQRQTFGALTAQRLQGTPIAYLIGRKEFYGLTLTITPAVLDPRDDTETLVDWGLERLATHRAPRVLDLGTGSGAIALALKSQRPDAEVWASDCSAAALAVAQANGRALGLSVRWLCGAWLSPVHQADAPPFDLIVSNPPYIAEADPHLPALRHEPLQALVSGSDGLQDIRQLARTAPAHLRPSGWLLLEHGWDQAAHVADILACAGFTQIQHRRDLAGHLRCTGGAWQPEA